MLPTPKPTQSYWTRTPIPIPDSPPPPSLPDSSETTILILGTGISAVSAAYSLLALTPATTRLLVLDARSPCDGATGRNGGHCKLVPHEELAKLTKRFGEESAVELVRFQMRHLECLRAICRLVDDEVARDEQEERGTEFRDVETVDIYLGKELFEEAKEKVERLRTAMPDVHVQVWEPTEAREVRLQPHALPVTPTDPRRNIALRCQRSFPWCHILPSRCRLPLPPGHKPLDLSRQNLSVPCHDPPTHPCYLHLRQFIPSFTGPHSQQRLLCPPRHPYYKRLRDPPSSESEAQLNSRSSSHDRPIPRYVLSCTRRPGFSVVEHHLQYRL